MFKRKLAGNIFNMNHCYDTRYRNDVTPSYQRLAQCQRSLSFCDKGPDGGPFFLSEVLVSNAGMRFL